MATRVLVATISKPFGVKGEMLLQVHGSKQHIGALLPNGKQISVGAETHTVQGLRRHRRESHLLSLTSITTLEQAASMRGRHIYVSSESLPPSDKDSYYHYQLLGLHVVSAGGDAVGKLERIFSTGANDVYLVETPDGRSILVPAITGTVLDIDLKSKMMTIDLDGCV